MDIFDLRGPEFLQLYMSLFAIALVAGLIWRFALSASVSGGVNATGEDAFDIAYLAGRKTVLANAVLASLVHREMAKVNASVEITFTPIPDVKLQPAEKHVMDAIKPIHYSLAEFRKLVDSDAIHKKLEERGLLLSCGQSKAATVVPALLMAIVLVIGIIKIAVGVSRDKPVGILVVFCIITLVAALIFLFRPAHRTRLGTKTLQAFRAKHATLRDTAKLSTASLNSVDVALALALFGPTMLTGDAFSTLRSKLIVQANSIGGGDGGSSCKRWWWRLRRRRMRRVRRRMMTPPNQLPTLPRLGLGIGWRPELAHAIEQRPSINFVEITAENFYASPSADVPIIPPALIRLHQRGVVVIPHGISLSLGGAEEIDLRRVRRLDCLAREFASPLVSEHIAFVRSAGVEAGHLLPIPARRESLEVLVENVRRAQDALSVPLALENISTLFEWPDAGMGEAEFISELLDRTGALLLLDVANIYANAKNLGGDPLALLDHLPLQKLAYVHLGGGDERDGIYHDTHGGPVPAGAFALLQDLCARINAPGVMLERDDHFPSEMELLRELDAIEEAVRMGGAARGSRMRIEN